MRFFFLNTVKETNFFDCYVCLNVPSCSVVYRIHSNDLEYFGFIKKVLVCYSFMNMISKNVWVFWNNVKHRSADNTVLHPTLNLLCFWIWNISQQLWPWMKHLFIFFTLEVEELSWQALTVEPALSPNSSLVVSFAFWCHLSQKCELREFFLFFF